MLRSQLRGLGHEQSLDAGRMSPFIEWRLAFQRHTPSMKNERAMVQALAEKGHIAARSLVGPMELAEIDRPIALIVGREDPVGSLDQWQEFIGHGQDARLTVIDNAGHMPWWDSPAEVANAIGPSRAAL
jgi:pimeloyl-ACP methyl ester carboxylesterase